MMKRLAVFFTILFVLVCNLSAKVWFVCAGSFAKYESAEERCQILSEEGYDCFIEAARKDDGSKIYRVFFLDDLFLRDEVRERKDQLKKADVIVKNGWTDLWICEADLPAEDSKNVFKATKAPAEIPSEKEQKEPVVELLPPVVSDKSVIAFEPEKTVVQAQVQKIPETKIVIPEEPVVLESNAEVPISGENPYSVLVRSYREEEKAVNDRERLKSLDIYAYVLKKYDDSSFFKFDLHAGAFKTEDEAEDYQDVLEEKGITDTEIADYEDFVEDLAKYDEVVAKEEVTLNTGAYVLPELISENVRKNISQFPINRDFQIVEATIVDNKNLKESELDLSDEIGDVPSDIFDLDDIDSFSYVKYRDELFDKELKIYIFQSENEIPGIEDFYDYKIEESLRKDFRTNYGILHSFILSEYEDEVFLFGYSDDKKMGILMSAENFSEKAFEAFMECSYSDSSLLVYPQIRRTLYVLPGNEKTKRNFLLYKLEKIDESYAEERNYVDWSLPIVGTWLAESFFDQNDEKISLSFFDLDYDYNANKTHGLFMNEKSENDISEYNKPVDVNGANGWFLFNFGDYELSFPQSSYIISIDSPDIELSGLRELADDLNIWKE